MPDSSDSTEQLPSRFVAVLAGKPPLVAIATFCVAAIVTAALMLTTRGMDAAGVVSILATVWALALAVVIYLLTAKDTDKLLDHIDALQEQLSATLDAPGPGALVVDKEPEPTEPVPTELKTPPSRGTEAGLTRMPADYMAAFSRATGLNGDDLIRAWTPMPSGAGPWVVEAADHYRWSVFGGRGGHITVIPLGNADRARQRFDARAVRRGQPHGIQ